MQDFKGKKILLGITGGIAAYKATYLLRELVKLGAEIKVVMTQSAKEFVSPLVLQALSGEIVRFEVFDLMAEQAMGHIELARWADFLLIAPATANFLAKMAHGIADDLLSTLYLVADVPVIVCPAMNRLMWEHKATQANCNLLIERSVIFSGPDYGIQACGELGFGRMSEVAQIINTMRLYNIRGILKGQKVLITAGPTRESIDPVRYISNHSSGKMGYALAEAAMIAGASVTLISGPTAIVPPTGVDFFKVDSAKEMLDAVLDNLAYEAIFIGAAAVADYYLPNPSLEKLKRKEQDSLSVTMLKNPDILSTVVSSKKAKYIVGFAAETDNVILHGMQKLNAKNVDMIVANKVGANIGFDRDENEVVLLTKNDRISFPLEHKTRLAGKIISTIAEINYHKTINSQNVIMD